MQCYAHPAAWPIARFVALFTQRLGVITVGLVIPVHAGVTEVTFVAWVTRTLPAPLPRPGPLVEVKASLQDSCKWSLSITINDCYPNTRKESQN